MAKMTSAAFPARLRTLRRTASDDMQAGLEAAPRTTVSGRRTVAIGKASPSSGSEKCRRNARLCCGVIAPIPVLSLPSYETSQVAEVPLNPPLQFEPNT
jgi:hypothetical protein